MGTLIVLDPKSEVFAFPGKSLRPWNLLAWCDKKLVYQGALPGFLAYFRHVDHWFHSLVFLSPYLICPDHLDFHPAVYQNLPLTCAKSICLLLGCLQCPMGLGTLNPLPRHVHKCNGTQNPPLSCKSSPMPPPKSEAAASLTHSCLLGTSTANISLSDESPSHLWLNFLTSSLTVSSNCIGYSSNEAETVTLDFWPAALFRDVCYSSFKKQNQYQAHCAPFPQPLILTVSSLISFIVFLSCSSSLILIYQKLAPSWALHPHTRSTISLQHVFTFQRILSMFLRVMPHLPPLYLNLDTFSILQQEDTAFTLSPLQTAAHHHPTPGTSTCILSVTH